MAPLQDFMKHLRWETRYIISTMDPAGLHLLVFDKLTADNKIKDAKIDALQKKNDQHQKQIDDVDLPSWITEGEMEN